MPACRGRPRDAHLDQRDPQSPSTWTSWRGIPPGTGTAASPSARSRARPSPGQPGSGARDLHGHPQSQHPRLHLRGVHVERQRDRRHVATLVYRDGDGSARTVTRWWASWRTTTISRCFTRGPSTRAPRRSAAEKPAAQPLAARANCDFRRAGRQGRAPRATKVGTDGQGHREADPPALADLLPDGAGQAGLRPGDQARGGGIQRHERRRLRAALLRGPRRAREPRDHPAGGEAGRVDAGLRVRALLAPARELLPRRDRLLRRRAGRAPDGALPARRRVRLRRAPATGSAAGLLGPAEPADLPRAELGRGADDGQGRRRRGVAAPLEDRDGDLAPQDDRVQLLHDRARRDREAEGEPVPPGLQGRAVLSDRPRARARRGPRLPPLADRRQGLLRLQGRARLQRPRGLRPPRLRPPLRVAAGRAHGTARIFISDRIAWLVERDFGSYGKLAQAREGRVGPGQGPGVRDRLRVRPPARRLGPPLAQQRDGAGARRARRRGDRAARPADRAPPRRVRDGAALAQVEAGGGPVRPLLERPLGVFDQARALRPPGHPRRDADRGREGRGATSRSPRSPTSSSSATPSCATTSSY